ncbi:MAG TPA: SRPBCC domain-containing protein [Myxococcota bacterium]
MSDPGRTAEHAIEINAAPAAVWRALTEIAQMNLWLGEPSMMVDVVTDWVVGGPITIRGFHHVHFENTGTVLAFEPERLLRYSHLSSIARVPDVPENHAILEFRIAPVAAGTSLTLVLSRCHDEVTFKHLDFYWRVTLGILAAFVTARQAL